MLIARRDGRLILIRQQDHGVLAGDIADLWGNDRFDAPKPLDQVRLGAAIHDDAWAEPDAEPLFHEGEGRPQSFWEMEIEKHIPLYRPGVEAAFRKDPYVGLLVSMHWTGLYRGRWGMQSRMIQHGVSGRTAVERDLDDAVDEQERHWIDVRQGLIQGEIRSEFEANLWHNYDLLQAYDFLSLFAGLGDHRPAPNAESQVFADIIRTVDHVPGPRRIQNVPTAIAGQRVELTLTAVEPSVVSVDPYPFQSDEVELSVQGTAIEDRRYSNQDEARAALEQGEKLMVTCRMIRGTRVTPGVEA